MTRYPLEPFMAVTGWSMAKVRECAPCNGSEYRLRLAGGVTERTADLLAVRAGLPACLVWPEIEQEAFVECAAPDCAERFVPHRKGHLYCSRNCRDRVGERRRYWSDPERREHKREARRSYYATCGDYERKRERRYRARRSEAA